jgi:hypothetical protein
VLASAHRCQHYAPLAPKTDTKTDYSKLSRNQNEACQLFYHLVGTQPFIIRLGNACRGRWRAPHRAPMVSDAFLGGLKTKMFLANSTGRQTEFSEQKSP